MAQILLLAAPAEDSKAWADAINGVIAGVAKKQAGAEQRGGGLKKHPEFFIVDFIRFCEHSAVTRRREGPGGGVSADQWAAVGHVDGGGDTDAAAQAAPVGAGDILALQEEGGVEMTEQVAKKRMSSKRSKVAGKMTERNVRTVV
jgi:hypothetical protein